MPYKILLADDHKLVRAGVSMMIQDIEGFEIIAEASNGLQALEMSRDLTPDLVIMDIHMPEMSGLEAIAQIHNEMPDIKILMLSMHANEEHVARAMSLGAMGYLLKDATPDELELAVKSVIAGNVWLSSAVSSMALTPSKDYSPEEIEFTDRQLEVLRRMAEGQTTKEIAYDMDLSVKTIETYRSQIMKKLDLKDLPSLVRYAIKRGIISL